MMIFDQNQCEIGMGQLYRIKSCLHYWHSTNPPIVLKE